MDPRVKWMIGFVTGKSVLDLGCVRHSIEETEKPGWLHDEIRKVARRVVGVDYLEQPVLRLREKGYEVICADVEVMKLDERFDMTRKRIFKEIVLCSSIFAFDTLIFCLVIFGVVPQESIGEKMFLSGVISTVVWASVLGVMVSIIIIIFESKIVFELRAKQTVVEENKTN